MKILLRNCEDKFYVWKNATYKENGYYIDDKFVPTVNILAVDEDDRANYVTCAHCGAIIKNDPKIIEAHFAEREAKRNCLKCAEMIPIGNEKNTKVNYTKNEDGTYHFTKACDTKLGCSYNSWRHYYEIDSEEAKLKCQYTQCRVKGVTQISDVFVKYPGLFNKQITIDWLVKNGFNNKSYCGQYRNQKEWAVDLGLRGNTLYAFVNELGIVDRFQIIHRYERWYAYYSEKYDKLFFVSGQAYTDEKPEALSQTKYNSAKKIIAKLYKEAK